MFNWARYPVAKHQHTCRKVLPKAFLPAEPRSLSSENCGSHSAAKHPFQSLGKEGLHELLRHLEGRFLGASFAPQAWAKPNARSPPSERAAFFFLMFCPFLMRGAAAATSAASGSFLLLLCAAAALAGLLSLLLQSLLQGPQKGTPNFGKP